MKKKIDAAIEVVKELTSNYYPAYESVSDKDKFLKEIIKEYASSELPLSEFLNRKNIMCWYEITTVVDVDFNDLPENIIKELYNTFPMYLDNEPNMSEDIYPTYNEDYSETLKEFMIQYENHTFIRLVNAQFRPTIMVNDSLEQIDTITYGNDTQLKKVVEESLNVTIIEIESVEKKMFGTEFVNETLCLKVKDNDKETPEEYDINIYLEVLS